MRIKIGTLNEQQTRARLFPGELKLFDAGINAWLEPVYRDSETGKLTDDHGMPVTEEEWAAK
jgi:hypothetical protein